MENAIYQVHKTKRISQTYLIRIMLSFFYNQRSNQENISQKQQAQVQMIRSTVPSTNVTQDNGNIC